MGSTVQGERPQDPPAVDSAPGVPAGAGRSLAQLAAELHDGLSQELFAAELDLHELRCLPGLTQEAREVVERIGRRLSAGAHQLRSVLLSTLEGEQSGDPVPAVAEGAQDLIDRFVRAHSIRAELAVTGEGPVPTASAARLLLRAVREGLANVAKHAGAARVEVLLRRDERWWTVVVCDDGSGDPESVRSQVAAARSFGLCSLRTDAARVGGRLTLDTAEGLGGVRLTVRVPAGQVVAD
jgi:signal transduction histidine kinase